MSFDKQAQITKMQPSINKLLAYLKSKNIAFSPTDEQSENVVLTSADKVVKISHHSFYRYSGRACFYIDKGENRSEAADFTDEMYVNGILRPVIDTLFEKM